MAPTINSAPNTNNPNVTSHSHKKKSSSFLTELFGTLQKDVAWLAQYSMAFIYICAMVGGYVMLVRVGYPKARASSHIADYHLLNGHLTFVLAVSAWLYIRQTNPGIITPETLDYYNHYEYDELLYVSGRPMDPVHKVPHVPRSKFDRYKYKAYVPRFDHYCGWIGNTVGEDNYRDFLVFVCTQLFLCVYTTLILFAFARGEILDHDLWNLRLFDLQTGEEFGVTKWIVFRFLLERNPWEASIFAITSTTSLLLVYFLAYHVRLTNQNLTTNEDYKWSQIQKWHAGAKMMYELAQKKKGNSSGEEPQAQKPLIIPDGDVGCTGGAPVPTEGGKESDADEATPLKAELEDPGPLPTNLYDKGSWKENWKEVIFPVSLQRKAAKTSKSKAT